MKKKNFIIFIIWILSIIGSILWTFENPEKIESIKNYFKKKEITEINIINESLTKVIANSFNVNFNRVLEINEKTAFIIHGNKKKFNTQDLEIYTQSGSLIKNLKSYRIRLPDHFTLQRNGGIKTIISYKGKRIALISSSEKDCFFASLILIENNQELFRSKCLPEVAKNNDFNGQGTLTIKGEGEYVGYVGQWKDNKFHGQGVYTHEDGTIEDGVWKEDEFNGQGTITLSNGQKSVGQFKKNKLKISSIVCFFH